MAKIPVLSVRAALTSTDHSSHRRRWLAGKPLDTEVRGYQRYEEGPDGVPIRAAPRAPSPKRKSLWAKEYALLRELGLR
jgi:hypothetical protein